ncbi:HAMP domain-containing sensor histidine kinase [Erythrobacteraceae bacterium WH01K]|nr:HAMP domain-containing sensor histidine kinase [Erythrobacteraceae bacterium WH01K]
MIIASSSTVHGRTDAQDRLVFADEVLASLQTRCGGELPGAVAVPELRELISKTRRFGVALSRDIRAFDGERTIRTWADARPDSNGEGCIITLANWRSATGGLDAASEQRRRNASDRATADAIVRLDSRQSIVHAVGEGQDVEPLVEQMNKAAGQDWKKFVDLLDIDHHQPVHWRLLDGAKCRIESEGRSFSIRLLPLGQRDPGSEGFELLLVADDPLPTRTRGPQPLGNHPSPDGLAGELGPVLRQPISRIIANAETIRARLAGPLPDEYSNYAADIATAGQHLLALVEDLADLEIVESDNFTTAPDPIDLVDVARQATGILGVRARDKQITLVEPAEGSRQPATGEFRRVLQILLNLIGNAINYAPPGTKVTIETREISGKPTISIIDQGPGMSAEDAARAFNKFERLGRSGDGGSGLGLHISRRLARAMGGDIVIESEEGKGARFTLFLTPQD